MVLSLRQGIFLMLVQEGKKKSGGTSLKKWVGPPLNHLSTPKTPIAVTLRGQKGYQSAPFSIPHPSTYSPY